MPRIIVAGAGHGGVTAAIKLLEDDFDVTIYEKCAADDIGLPQKDAFDEDSMIYAGLPVPESFRAPKNRLTFVPLDSDVESLTLPVGNDEGALCADRKELINYLLSLAKESGVKLVTECEVLAPIILGSRIAGIKTTKGDFYADLIIDACGVNSPLRRNLPDFTFIQKELTEFDVLHTYRAYFDKVPGAKEPPTDYNLYIKDDGTVGFSWLITEKEDTDVLIGRFGEITTGDILERLRVLNSENPHMGKTLVHGGNIHDIPVRQPLAVFVADGYAAVGDSACMTYPVKGSGIGYSLRAGTMLAKAVKDDTELLFTAETLWEYEKEFFKEIGFDACRLAILKNLLPYVTAQEVNDLFREKIITTDELIKLTSDTLSALLNAHGITAIKDKIKLLNNHPDSRAKLLNLIKWFGKFTVTEPFFPNKYDRAAVGKWAEKYDEMFESIKYKENTELVTNE